MAMETGEVLLGKERQRVLGEMARTGEVQGAMWKSSAGENSWDLEGGPSKDSYEWMIWILNQSSSLTKYGIQCWNWNPPPLDTKSWTNNLSCQKDVL